MKTGSRPFMLLIIIILILGCTKKEDRIDAQPKLGEIKEDIKENSEAKPHPVMPVPEQGEKDKKMEQAEKIMARIHDYRERLEKNPKDLEALIVLGNANYDMKRYEKSEEMYVRALEIDPKNLFVRTDLASAYKYTGNVERAISELKKVLSFDPRHKTALYNLGVILLNDKKDREGAIKAWEDIINHDPKSSFSIELQKKVSELKKSNSTKQEQPSVN